MTDSKILSSQEDESPDELEPGIQFGDAEETGQATDTGPGALNDWTVTTGTYYLNTTEDDWEIDTCGVAAHETRNYEIWVDIVGSYLTLLHDWTTTELGIQHDGSFTMESGQNTEVEYSDACVVTLTVQGLGQVMGEDNFELTVITNRTGQGDCEVALSDLDSLPCEEIRTWNLSKSKAQY